ncbi:hypothetical protein ACM66B_003827 [Microbotryomycetes sp. NB124-2]
MPPRKKSSKAAATAPEVLPQSGGIDDYTMPRSIITRIAKSSVPPETKMQRDVATGLMHGSAVFVSYVTMLANDIAMDKGQKTISAQHVLDAVKQLGWDDQSQVLKALRSELTMFRKIAEAKKKGESVPSAPPTSLVRPYRESGSNAATAATATSKQKLSAKKVPKRPKAAVDGQEEREAAQGAQDSDRESRMEDRSTNEVNGGEEDDAQDQDAVMLGDDGNERDEAEGDFEEEQPVDVDGDEAEDDGESERDVAEDEGEEEDMPEDEEDALADDATAGSEEEEDDG